MFAIKYQGANHQREDGSVYGAFSYYADPADAFRFHHCVTKMVVWVDNTMLMSAHKDYLGKFFREATAAEQSAYDKLNNTWR